MYVKRLQLTRHIADRFRNKKFLKEGKLSLCAHSSFDMVTRQPPPLARVYSEFQWAPQLYPLHSEGLLQWGRQHYPNESVVNIRKRLAKSLFDQIFETGW